MKDGKIPTVTVGIPALNEGKNIQNILRDINNQHKDGYILEGVYIISDGSTDDTVARAQSLRSNKIHVISHSRRIGKPRRINEIFALSNSDIVVILDADIRLASANVLPNLIKGFIDRKVELVSGYAHPTEATNFISRTFIEGLNVWNNARWSKESSAMYLCEGSIRAFNKDLYKKLTFPDSSADDAYPFLFLADESKFAFVKSAMVYFKPPTTFRDVVTQQRRFLRSKSIQTNHFDEDVVNKYFVVGMPQKIRALTVNLFKEPFWTLMYLALMIATRITVLISNKETTAKWTMVTSTK